MAWREDSDLEFKLIALGIPVKRLASAIVIHPARVAKWGISLKEQKKTLYNALLYSKYPDLYRKKIQPQPPVLYYLVIISFLALLTGIGLRAGTLIITGGVAWLSLIAYFAAKRLSGTDHSGRHILEMIFTSLLIPFCSLYWQWYGAIKYRVLFV